MADSSISPEFAAIGAIWRRRRTIVLLALIGAAGGLLGTFAEVPRYEADGSLIYRFEREYYPQDPTADSWQGDPIRFELSDAIQTDMEILGSQRLLAATLDGIGGVPAWTAAPAPDDASPLAEMRNWLKGLRAARQERAAPDPAALREQTLAAVREALSIRRVEGTSVVNLSLTHPDPALAKRFLDTLIANYFKVRAEILDRNQLATLETEVAAAESASASARAAVAAFRQAHGLFDIPTQRQQLLDARDRESERIAQDLEPRIRALRERPGVPAAARGATPSAGGAAIAIAPEDSDGAPADATLAQLNAELNRAVERQGEAERQLQQLTADEAALDQLDRTASARQDELDRVSEIRDKVRLSARLEGASGPAIAVLDAPSVLPDPVGLSTATRVVLGAALGALVGFVLALLRAWAPRPVAGAGAAPVVEAPVVEADPAEAEAANADAAEADAAEAETHRAGRSSIRSGPRRSVPGRATPAAASNAVDGQMHRPAQAPMQAPSRLGRRAFSDRVRCPAATAERRRPAAARRLRVVQVIDGFGHGGAERIVADYAIHLARLGFATPLGAAAPPRRSRLQPRGPGRTHLHALPDPDRGPGRGRSGMKIALVETDARGGLIHFTDQLAEGLAAAGADATILTGSDYELAALPHRSGVAPIPRLWPQFDPPAETGLRRRARAALRSAWRGWRAAVMVRERWRLTRAIEAEAPDVVVFGIIRFPFQLFFLRRLRRRGIRLAQICHEFGAREAGGAGRASRPAAHRGSGTVDQPRRLARVRPSAVRRTDP